MEAERAEVVHAEDVVGVAVGVEDGVEAADAGADGLGVEVGAGVDDDVVAFPGDEDGGPGAAVARVAGGRSGGGADGAVAAERGDAHRGAVPRKVRVASIWVYRTMAGPARLAAAGRAGAWRRRLAVGGGAGQGLGDLEEAHADFEEGVVDELRLGRGEVALGLFGEDGEHVDALARAHQVDLGLLALLGGSAELHDGGHVDGLDDLVEAHRGRVIHAGIGGADGGVEALRGLLIGGVGLFHLAGGWRRREVGIGGWLLARRLRAARARGGGDLNSSGGSGAGAAAGVSRDSGSGEGSASGRGVPSRVNLRRSVTTKGLFCSDIVTLSHTFRCQIPLQASAWIQEIASGDG